MRLVGIATCLAILFLSSFLFSSIPNGYSEGENWLIGWNNRKSVEIQNITSVERDHGARINVAYTEKLDAVSELHQYENTPVTPTGTTNSWNEKIRETGNMIYTPIDTGKEFKTWYTAYKGTYDGYTNVVLGYAYSSDGVSWTQQQCKLNNMPADRTLEDPYIVEVDSVFYLYAELKMAADSQHDGIARLNSTDGLTWNYEALILEEQGSEWESQDVSSPTVWREGPTWYMLYEGRSLTQAGKIGKCQSTEGSTWSNRTLVFQQGVSGKWDDFAVVCDQLLKIGPTYYLFYHGTNESVWRSGIAKTTDFSNWMRLNDGNAIPFDSDEYGSSPTATIVDGDILVYDYFTDTSGIFLSHMPNNTISLEGDSRTDFADVRFTDEDGSTMLDYSMDSKVEGDHAVFWVKTADSNNTSPITIYIYYGNPDVPFEFPSNAILAALILGATLATTITLILWRKTKS